MALACAVVLARAVTLATTTPGSPARLPSLTWNQNLIESFESDAVDLNDPVAVFAHVFARLPAEVVVYPSENYYYFILVVAGRQIWGNIRLPAGSRDRGVLSFGYFEFVEFPSLQPAPGLTGSKYLTEADGLAIEKKLDDFTYGVRYGGKEVTFHLHRIEQLPPRLFALGDGETFVSRTFDESGYQFFLLFNEPRAYFFWVLNEESDVPDTLAPQPATPEIVVGRRSGFAFWVDAAHGNRKVLTAVRRLSTMRNDYYDGPFDQLADNYADEVRIAEYMARASPALKGRIDKYGYYTDRERPMRVALSSYYTYLAASDLTQFMERAKAAPDPYEYISRRGIPVPAAVPPTAGASPPPAATGVPAAPAGNAATPPPGRSTVAWPALAGVALAAVGAAFWLGRRLGGRTR